MAATTQPPAGTVTGGLRDLRAGDIIVAVDGVRLERAYRVKAAYGPLPGRPGRGVLTERLGARLLDHVLTDAGTVTFNRPERDSHGPR